MSDDLKQRTKEFALRIIKLYGALPKTTEAQVMGKQALRSGTSVGAHYREAGRSRSKAEFVSKIEVGLQELEETTYWLELLTESNMIREAQVSSLVQEASKLNAVLKSCVKKVKAGERLKAK